MNARTDTDGANGLQEKALSDRYFLHRFLWCGLCDQPLEPLLVRQAVRYYHCPHKQCPRPLVPAEVMEQRVWNRFMLLNEVFAHAVPRNRRHEVLREVLKRVVVGRTSVDLTFEWRD